MRKELAVLLAVLVTLTGAWWWTARTCSPEDHLLTTITAQVAPRTPPPGPRGSSLRLWGKCPVFYAAGEVPWWLRKPKHRRKDHVDMSKLLLVGVLTTRKYMLTRMPHVVRSWAANWTSAGVVRVITDELHGKEVELLGEDVIVYDSKCPSTLAGLCCKTSFLLRDLAAREEVKDVRWVLRVMDDTYVHMGNLRRLLGALDHHQPYVIGAREVVDVQENHEHGQSLRFQDPDGHLASEVFPQGGAGWLVSRGALRELEKHWSEYDAQCQASGLDDLAFGRVVRTAQLSVTKHCGFAKNAVDVRNDAKARVRNVQPCAVPRAERRQFFPVTFHLSSSAGVNQVRTVDEMETLHEVLHGGDYAMTFTPSLYHSDSEFYSLIDCR